MRAGHAAGAAWKRTAQGRAAALRAVERLSLALGGARWAFLPLGLFALMAVGVHAAADRVDDSLRALLQQVDAVADAVWGLTRWTQGWVEGVGERECTRVARALVLLWELGVAGVMGLPLLGYVEEAAPAPLREALRHRWLPLVREAVRRPTLMGVSRPLGALCFVLAGLVALGQTLQAAVFHAAAGVLGGEGLGGSAALLLARLGALAAMAGVAASLGGRAVLRHLQHTQLEDDVGRSPLWRVLHGLPGTVAMAPLAAAALAAIGPLLGFFR